jgi:large subunit ribosomal protein L6|tara:strand:- start:994 stop:1527 length:534 start_codon:yes stop_codon:yes gene_type:complete
MARTAIKPISIPNGVEVSFQDNILSFSGKEGKDTLVLNSLTNVNLEKESLTFNPIKDTKEALEVTGTMRALASNIMIGVRVGFEKKLEINGVGYRANLKDGNLELSLGFSHPVVYKLPEEISLELLSQTELILKSINKQKLGQVAAEIRAFRPPEPYKGKGIKYSDEFIKRKESKKA